MCYPEKNTTSGMQHVAGKAQPPPKHKETWDGHKMRHVLTPSFHVIYVKESLWEDSDYRRLKRQDKEMQHLVLRWTHPGGESLERILFSQWTKLDQTVD